VWTRRWEDNSTLDIRETLTNKNYVQEEIKSRLKSANAVIPCRSFCLPVCYPRI